MARHLSRKIFKVDLEKPDALRNLNEDPLRSATCRQTGTVTTLLWVDG